MWFRWVFPFVANGNFCFQSAMKKAGEKILNN